MSNTFYISTVILFIFFLLSLRSVVLNPAGYVCDNKAALPTKGRAVLHLHCNLPDFLYQNGELFFPPC